MWHFPGVRELREKWHFVCFDMCMHGGKMDGSYYKKPTSILTNCPSLFSLARKCSGSHQHIKLEGVTRVGGRSVSRTLLAGAYPPEVVLAVGGGVGVGFC